MKKTIIAANWKMNMGLLEAGSLAESFESFAAQAQPKSEVVVCGTFIQLPQLAQICRDVTFGAQDVYFEDNGAFTGEISSEMLLDVGARYVLTGHSERRHVLGETDEIVNKKTFKAVSENLNVIFCVGETEAEREAGKTNQVLKRQVEKGLEGLFSSHLERIVVAYEPVWAIGTGKNASRNDAEDAITKIKEVMAEMFSEEEVANVSFLYGGSVKPENVTDFSNSPVIDGVLVGGASLALETFAPLVEAFEKRDI